MKRFTFIIAALLLLQLSFAQTKPGAAVKPKTVTTQKAVVPAKGRLVQMTTNYGIMVIMLYDATPMHRDNFISLVKQGIYDSLLFHRVIQGFMIQGGDPQSKYADSLAMLGNGEVPGVDMIPAEFKPALFHKKGALAAARTDNPEKASSNCQFYIVQGRPYSDIELNQVECNIRSNNPEFTYTDVQRKTYKTIGGVPFLDQNYTVFGEVIKGLDVIDKIAAVEKDSNDRPLKNVRFKIKMLN
ncbi:MAG TPA: peptidylprolyl isomerase [Panacibacter sp.]|nr:peptidylprolyl isomerase [Panacibacter sp.]